MILSILGGAAWGLLAAGVHLAHLHRTVRRRTRGEGAASIGRIQAASLVRIGMVAAVLFAGSRFEWVRMDACLITFATAHLASTAAYGVWASKRESAADDLKKEVGLSHG